jgi:GGDEF domain-containing protein
MKLREAVGRILGYQDRIDALTTKLQELSWDSVFGMWTRTAFLQFCRVMPRGERTVVFIDLDGIHALNQAEGYAEVDRRVKAAFSIPMRSSDVIARWYSGDEIVILFDNDREGALQKIRALEASAASQGLTFTYVVGTWNVGVQGIVDVVDALASANRVKQAAGREAGHER